MAKLMKKIQQWLLDIIDGNAERQADLELRWAQMTDEEQDLSESQETMNLFFHAIGSRNLPVLRKCTESFFIDNEDNYPEKIELLIFRAINFETSIALDFILNQCLHRYSPPNLAIYRVNQGAVPRFLYSVYAYFFSGNLKKLVIENDMWPLFYRSECHERIFFLEWLWENYGYPKEIQSDRDMQFFINCLQHGYIDVVDFVWNRYSEKSRLKIAEVLYVQLNTLKVANVSGLKWILDLYQKEPYKKQHDKIQNPGLVAAAKSGDFKVINWVFKNFPDQDFPKTIREFIEDATNLSTVIQLEMFEFFWKHCSTEQKKQLIAEHGRYLFFKMTQSRDGMLALYLYNECSEKDRQMILKDPRSICNLLFSADIIARTLGYDYFQKIKDISLVMEIIRLLFFSLKNTPPIMSRLNQGKRELITWILKHHGYHESQLVEIFNSQDVILVINKPPKRGNDPQLEVGRLIYFHNMWKQKFEESFSMDAIVPNGNIDDSRLSIKANENFEEIKLTLGEEFSRFGKNPIEAIEYKIRLALIQNILSDVSLPLEARQWIEKNHLKLCEGRHSTLMRQMQSYLKDNQNPIHRSWACYDPYSSKYFNRHEADNNLEKRYRLIHTWMNALVLQKFETLILKKTREESELWFDAISMMRLGTMLDIMQVNPVYSVQWGEEIDYSEDLLKLRHRFIDTLGDVVSYINQKLQESKMPFLEDHEKHLLKYLKYCLIISDDMLEKLRDVFLKKFPEAISLDKRDSDEIEEGLEIAHEAMVQQKAMAEAWERQQKNRSPICFSPVKGVEEDTEEFFDVPDVREVETPQFGVL